MQERFREVEACPLGWGGGAIQGEASHQPQLGCPGPSEASQALGSK